VRRMRHEKQSLRQGGTDAKLLLGEQAESHAGLFHLPRAILKLTTRAPVGSQKRTSRLNYPNLRLRLFAEAIPRSVPAIAKPMACSNLGRHGDLSESLKKAS
jgi:hypothetical protein